MDVRGRSAKCIAEFGVAVHDPVPPRAREAGSPRRSGPGRSTRSWVGERRDGAVGACWGRCRHRCFNFIPRSPGSVRRVATALATSPRRGLADGDLVLHSVPPGWMAVERGSWLIMPRRHRSRPTLRSRTMKSGPDGPRGGTPLARMLELTRRSQHGPGPQGSGPPGSGSISITWPGTHDPSPTPASRRGDGNRDGADAAVQDPRAPGRRRRPLLGDPQPRVPYRRAGAASQFACGDGSDARPVTLKRTASGSFRHSSSTAASASCAGRQRVTPTAAARGQRTRSSHWSTWSPATS